VLFKNRGRRVEAESLCAGPLGHAAGCRSKTVGGSENSQTVEKLPVSFLQSFLGIEFAVNFSDAKKPFMSQGHKGPPAGGPLEPFVMVEHFAM
jgi:hypothetical protein